MTEEVNTSKKTKEVKAPKLFADELILIAVVDGLKGLVEAINTAYPRTTVQTCIVHLIRNGLDYAAWKDRKAVAQVLRPIYAASEDDAPQGPCRPLLTALGGPKCPTIV